MQRAEMVLGLSQNDRTIVFGHADVLKCTDAVRRERSGRFQCAGERDAGDEYIGQFAVMDPAALMVVLTSPFSIRTTPPFSGTSLT